MVAVVASYNYNPTTIASAPVHGEKQEKDAATKLRLREMAPEVKLEELVPEPEDGDGNHDNAGAKGRSSQKGKESAGMSSFVFVEASKLHKLVGLPNHAN